MVGGYYIKTLSYAEYREFSQGFFTGGSFILDLRDAIDIGKPLIIIKSDAISFPLPAAIGKIDGIYVMLYQDKYEYMSIDGIHWEDI